VVQHTELRACDQGDAPRRGQVVQSDAARFWSKVSRSEGCWEWRAYRDRDGYGRFGTGSRLLKTRFVHYAHVYAYRAEVGPVPAGKLVRHLCNRPWCVRPDHLAVGTQLENMADMVAAGRSTRGTRNAQAKLNDAKVLAIRERLRAGHGTARLAAMYGVSESAIHQIRKGVIWRHLLPADEAAND